MPIYHGTSVLQATNEDVDKYTVQEKETSTENLYRLTLLCKKWKTLCFTLHSLIKNVSTLGEFEWFIQRDDYSWQQERASPSTPSIVSSGLCEQKRKFNIVRFLATA